MSECASTATADYRYWNTGTTADGYSREVATLIAGQAASVGCTGCSCAATERCRSNLSFSARNWMLAHLRSFILIQPRNWLTAWSSWEACSSSPRQDIPCTSCRPTIHCCFHMILPFVPNLSINPVHHNHANFNSDVRHPAVLFSNWMHKVDVRPNTTEFYFM